MNFQSGGATGFVYDDALAAYGMLHADGTPQLDANTGTQAVFDNLRGSSSVRGWWSHSRG